MWNTYEEELMLHLMRLSFLSTDLHCVNDSSSYHELHETCNQKLYNSICCGPKSRYFTAETALYKLTKRETECVILHLVCIVA